MRSSLTRTRSPRWNETSPKIVSAIVCAASKAPLALRLEPYRYSKPVRPATNRIAANGPDAIQVEITTLDTFCRQSGVPAIDFLKIDVEGAEVDVLRGARELFAERRVDGGMIEICPGNLRQFETSVADLRAFFAEHDYDLCWWDSEGRPSDPISADVPDDFLGNAAFMPRLPGRVR